MSTQPPRIATKIRTSTVHCGTGTLIRMGTLLGTGILLLAGFAASNAHAQVDAWTVVPITETVDLEAPDDVCFWAHPTDRSKSLVLGTHKDFDDGGLIAWTLDGGVPVWDNLSSATGGTNNVDIRYGFAAEGESWDLVCTSNRVARTIDVFRVVTETDGDFLTLVQEGSIPIGSGFAPDTDAPYGCAMFQTTDDRFFVFISDKIGNVGQFELSFDGAASPGERITGTRGAFWDLSPDNSEVEGIVADDLLETIYVAAEDFAIYRYAVDDDGWIDLASELVIATHDEVAGPFVKDAEGLAIWYSSQEGEGYFVASSQGAGFESSDYYSTYAVFDRAFAPGQPNDLVLHYKSAAGPGDLDVVTESDGIDFLNLDCGPTYPSGVMATNDDINEGENENYKFFSWYDIATAPDSSSDHLRYIGDGTEIGWDPRIRAADGSTSSTPESGGTEPGQRQHLAATVQVSPQPFAQGTTIHFEITGERQFVRVQAFNAHGQVVTEIAARDFSTGRHRLAWGGTDSEGRALPAGTYWIRVEASGEHSVARSVLLR